MYSFFRIAIFAAVSTLAATAHALPPATEPGEPFLYEAATHFIENPGCAQSGSPCTFDLYFGDNYKTTVTATRKQIENLKRIKSSCTPERGKSAWMVPMRLVLLEDGNYRLEQILGGAFCFDT